MISSAWSYRYLVFSLVNRQFRLRYRQSSVGFGWAILPPLTAMGAATLVFGSVLGIRTGDTSYPVFTLAALVPWLLFNSSVTSGVNSVVGSSSMVTKIPFPRVVLPVASVGLALVDFGLAVLFFVPFAFLFGDGIAPTAVWFPVLILVELILAAGIALFFSAMNVFARDVRVFMPLLMQLWLFVTPVMYPLPLDDVSGPLRLFLVANPMRGLTNSFREVLIHNNAPSLDLLMPSLIGAAVAFVIGFWYFKTTERRFADVI